MPFFDADVFLYVSIGRLTSMRIGRVPDLAQRGFECLIHMHGTQVNLEPGREAEFAVELLPRFSSPVEARLTFWAARTKGGMAPASNMVFTLK